MEIRLANFPQRGIEWRHDRGDDDPADPFHFDVLHREKIAKQHTIFIYRLCGDGCHAPVRDQQFVTRRAVLGVGIFPEDAQDGMSVSDVENQQHKR